MDASNAQVVSLAVLAVSTGIATAVDLKHRRIPNTLSLATAVAGVALATAGLTGITLWSSLAGLGLGLVLMLPGHLFGATGAGDVKLFAAAGSVLGASQTVKAFLFVAIAGGLLAVVIAVRRGRLKHTVTRTAALCGRPSSARDEIESPAADNRFAYGPAIAVGCIVAALL
jgi:prepilin peptidase CpaA